MTSLKGMGFIMNNKIFNLVAVLNETFKEIDIDFDDHMEVMNSIGFLHLFDDLKDFRLSIPWWRSHPIHENRATESIWTEPCNPLLRATKSTKRATSA